MKIRVVEAETVGKKKSDSKASVGSMVRLSDPAAELLRRAAAVEGLSISAYFDSKVVACVEKAYRESLSREAKRMGEKP